jgi:hypothetical protein
MREPDDANLLLVFNHRSFRRDVPQATGLTLVKPRSVLIEDQNCPVGVETSILLLCIRQID